MYRYTNAIVRFNIGSGYVNAPTKRLLGRLYLTW